MNSRTLMSACLTAGLATPVLAAEFVETFDSGNEGAWTWGANDAINPFGGNPGAHFQTSLLDTFAPRPRTTAAESEFTGDYRAKGVTSIGIDLITVNNPTTGGRPLSPMLIHDNGTPGDPFDDTAAYFLGPNIPHNGEGWLTYDFDVPSAETSLPAGWLLLNLGDSGAPANHTWDEVIQDVSQLQYHYGDPTFVFIFQQWQLSMDNVRITTGGGSPVGDLNGDGVTDFADLLILLGQWGFCGVCAADLDGDGSVGFSDLLILLGNWS